MKVSSNRIQSLAQRVGKGDQKALSELYHLTYPQLYRYGLRVIGKQATEVLEDVLADFFLWVAKNHRQLSKITDFEAYMYRSVRQNLQQSLAAAYKKQGRQQRFLERTASLTEKHGPSPEKEWITTEEILHDQEKVKKALDQLPAYQREALHLRFYEERDYTEIAALLHTNPQVARNYVYRAIQGLKKHFGTLQTLFL